MKDNNVYRKMDNGRYVPVGVYCGDDQWLPDGIWYVRHHDNSLWLHYGGNGNMGGGGNTRRMYQKNGKRKKVLNEKII